MNDRRLEVMIGNLLRAGVLLAAATVLAGGMLYLARHGAERVNYHTFRPVGDESRNDAGIVQSAVHGKSAAIIQIGLLLLVLTPVARVAMALVGFSLERDRLYAVVSLIVLVILLSSLVHAT